jgi:hypothetical protein
MLLLQVTREKDKDTEWEKNIYLRLNNNSQIRKKIFVPPLPQMTQESN